MKSIIMVMVLYSVYQGHEVKGSDCRENWIRYGDTDRCYYISDDYASFDVAQKHCESENSQFASVLTDDDELILSSILAPERDKCDGYGNCLEFWIGVRDITGDNEWTTVESIAVDKENQFWAKGYPKSNGRCVLMSFEDNRTKGLWKNEYCERPLKFVCISHTSVVPSLPLQIYIETLVDFGVVLEAISGLFGAVRSVPVRTPKLSNVERDAGCPKGWISFRDNGRCFFISDSSATYENAQTSCESMKSQLAPPVACRQQGTLSGLLTEFRHKCRKGENCLEFWVDIHNINGGNWRTSKGLEVKNDRECRQWARGFPKEKEGRCVIMSFIDIKTMGVLKNTDCTSKLKYVCVACPNNFEYFPEIDQCLYFNSKPHSWEDARKACTKMTKGAQMLTIQDSTKQTVVAKYAEFHMAQPESAECFYFLSTPYGRTIWLNAQTQNPKDCKTPYVWKPVGSPLIPFNYSNWYPGMPNCAFNVQFCAGTVLASPYKYQWDDFRCIDYFCSICEL